MARLWFLSSMEGSPWGASEELWSSAALLALADGHEVTVCMRRWEQVPPRLSELERAGAVLRWRTPLPLKLPFEVPLVQRFRDAKLPPLRLEERPADVVCWSHGALPDVTWQAWAQRLGSRVRAAGVPYVTVSHGFDGAPPASEGQRQLGLAHFAGAARALFLGPASIELAERWLAARLPGAGVFRNAVTLVDAPPLPAEPAVRMACVGRLVAWQKGQDLLLDALGRAKGLPDTWELSFYGEGPDRAYLEQLTAMYGLAGKVRFRGHESDLARIWAESELLVLPSRIEGLSLAALEAMSAGRPVLATAVGEMRTWVTERTGFVAAPDADSLAGALEQAAAARRDWGALGAEAREAARSRYAAGDPARELLDTMLSVSRA
ncbi:glycosyltransferase family 4 protein [Motilibacter aurantiacus]|uniref:glycosyltransferase family 4 protein n=1 Tax=Motilibacter aurantiacus TaxID=2714955 RepID=UPI00140C6D30|nr:glycosyltransferase family 4 protein [Motilibacter aurantiacus]NHC45913.1 glycosyltransferase family 4 protein [Motilibacter aurantiacus]